MPRRKRDIVREPISPSDVHDTEIANDLIGNFEEQLMYYGRVEESVEHVSRKALDIVIKAFDDVGWKVTLYKATPLGTQGFNSLTGMISIGPIYTKDTLIIEKPE